MAPREPEATERTSTATFVGLMSDNTAGSNGAWKPNRGSATTVHLPQ